MVVCEARALVKITRSDGAPARKLGSGGRGAAGCGDESTVRGAAVTRWAGGRAGGRAERGRRAPPMSCFRFGGPAPVCSSLVRLRGDAPARPPTTTMCGGASRVDLRFCMGTGRSDGGARSVWSIAICSRPARSLLEESGSSSAEASGVKARERKRAPPERIGGSFFCSSTLADALSLAFFWSSADGVSWCGQSTLA